MKKILRRILLVALAAQAHSAIAQTPQWILFDKNNSPLPSNVVNAIAQDSAGVYWIGTDPNTVLPVVSGGGLARFDGKNWKIYDPTNSGLPDHKVEFVAVSPSGAIWTATFNGVARLRDTTWTVFNTSNSGLPSNRNVHIAIENENSIWIGTYDKGVAHYDVSGNRWKVYDLNNSGLTSNAVNFIVIDSANVKWIGTDYGGLFSFDGTIWKQHTGNDTITPFNRLAIAFAIDQSNYNWFAEYEFTTGHMPLAKFKDSSWTFFDSTAIGFRPLLSYNGIAIDRDNVKWFATWDGLFKYNDRAWTKFNATDAGLPANRIWSICIDNHGNKVLGLVGFGPFSGEYGLVFFNEEGVKGITTAVKEKNTDEPPRHFLVLRSYPNPFNPATTVEFTVPETGWAKLMVIDVTGRMVAILFDAVAAANRIYRVSLKDANLAGGVYFAQLEAGALSRTRKIALVR